MRFLIPITLLFPSLLAVGEPVALRPVVSGLDRPVHVVVAAHDQMYVAEQAGRILFVKDGEVQFPLFLDLSGVVDCCDNGGLLSFAFHPRYVENGRLFVMYVNRDGDTTVAEYKRSGIVPNTADLQSARTLLVVDQPVTDRPNHHGGTLQFGSDGYLYISIGDGGVSQGVTNRAQDLHLFLGKLLRIDVDRGAPYAIPPDNPFVNVAGAAPEIWAFGLRNPWRFSFDTLSGQLVLGDVGQDLWEELNVLNVHASRGANFGWPRTEATHCFPPGTSCDTTGLTLPVVEYSRGDGCSITAGYRYRGALIPAIAGDYIYGDWCSGVIFAASHDETGWRSIPILHTGRAIVSFAADGDGELYVVDYLGSVLRLEPLTPRRHAAHH